MSSIMRQLIVYLLIVPYFYSCVTSADPDPDYGASIDQLILSRGFNYEKHFIQTKDSYILGVYRLINPYVEPSLRFKLKPIVLQHGLFASGTDFLINSPGGEASPCRQSIKLTSNDNNLGFLLSNFCFDVWISNSRGNFYSRNHTKLNPDKDKEYWKFSFDQMISYDSPAIIDYVLNVTGFTSLSWIGHSQGTMIMFGLLADQPHYSMKVKPFIALAPVCYVQHIQMALKLFAKFPGLMWALRQLGGELNDDTLALKLIDSLTCPSIGKETCHYLLYSILGYNLSQVNVSRVDVYRGQGWPGTSLWNLVHFGQNVAKGGFNKFDYGTAQNLIHYGGPDPPKYPLDQINSTSIALLYSKSDDLGDKEDVAQLIDSLKVPLLRDYFIPLPSWNHLDFLYGKDAYLYVNSIVLETLSGFHLKNDETN